MAGKIQGGDYDTGFLHHRGLYGDYGGGVDCIYRLLMFRWLLTLALLGAPVASFADSYSVQLQYNAVGQRFSTPDAACQKYISQYSYWAFVSSEISGEFGQETFNCNWRNINTNTTGFAGPFTVSYICPSGGTRSGTQCINAPACPTGTIRDTGTGQCISCPAAGTPAIIAIKSGSVDEQNGVIDIDLADKTAVYEGAEYSFNQSDYIYDSSYVKSNGDIMSKYNARATGNCSTSSNTADSPTSSSGRPSQPSSNSGNCFTDTKGNTVCKDSPQQNYKCGTVNGVQVCFDTTNGTGTVNGQPYVTSEKNCGYVNGQPVCVSSNSDSPTTTGCLYYGGVRNCVNSDVKVTTDTTTTTNPDGSKTTTTTKQDNVINTTPDVTTTTQRPDGSTTTTQSPGTTIDTSGLAKDSTLQGINSTLQGVAKDSTLQGVNSTLHGIRSAIDGLGNGNGTQETQTDCDKHPDSIGCAQFGETSSGDSLGTQEAGNGFSPQSLGSSGSCPAPLTASLSLGPTITFRFDMLCQFASMISAVVIAIGWLIAGKILIGGVRE
jgi:hypothetical protein